MFICSSYGTTIPIYSLKKKQPRRVHVGASPSSPESEKRVPSKTDPDPPVGIARLIRCSEAFMPLRQRKLAATRFAGRKITQRIVLHLVLHAPGERIARAGVRVAPVLEGTVSTSAEDRGTDVQILVHL